MNAKPTLISVRMGDHVRINMGALCKIYEISYQVSGLLIRFYLNWFNNKHIHKRMRALGLLG